MHDKVGIEFETYMGLDHAALSIIIAQDVGMYDINLMFLHHIKNCCQQARLLSCVYAKLCFISANAEGNI